MVAKAMQATRLRASGALPHDSARVSIIVVSWNTRDLLERCLSSVLEPSSMGHGPLTFDDVGASCPEVIVVDNASADGSADMVRQRFPGVQLLQNATNVGFARANNQGMHQCAGQYVLLLNPDTEVHGDAIEVLLRFMDKHPEAGAAGARLVNPDGTLQISCSPAPTLLRELSRMFHLDAVSAHRGYAMQRWSLSTHRLVDVVQGACLILRQQALDEVGLLDEDYFIYSEEVDLCHRLRKHHWQIWWVPQAVVTHYGGQSTRQVAAAMFLQLYRAKVQYFRKNHGRNAAQLYKLILGAAGLARLLVTPLALAGREPERSQRLLVARHYQQLLKALPGL